ncbi:4-hydroxy-tetrahydrodipicolinate reductase [Campylobacter sp. RM12640]|uniref:4-hydroxy-tetrahydrodipicolinate reductase n=1 Tax=unclassified Campylobacter TaxID=2593542 RepID=UPI003014F4D9|nr:4-hydroxy-tetrahydrodipicolinate reductase [Campylobacter sp. RM12640]MBZ7989142.1 4-hydroxy-tetrahydrodipicolinate reductase [Campylobacter sp. RM12635]
MINLAVFGANGRMGKELVKLALADENIDLVYSFTKENNDYNELFKANVIIDFSTPAASVELLEKASLLDNPPALVVGTTGLKDEYFKKAKTYEGKFFWASNTSLGVAILNELTKIAALALKEFDIEIYEKHHKHKVDAPSGTALTLAKNALEARNKALNKEHKICFNREGKREDNEIGLVSLRGGSVAGYHSVGFYGDDESIELIHNANSRAIFAKGAINVAKWLITKENKNYSMSDFVGELLNK